MNDKYPQLIDKAEFRLIWANFVVLDRMLLLKNYKKLKEYKEVLRFLKKHVLDVLKSNEFYVTRKIGAIALKINVRLYRILVVYNNKKNSRASYRDS